MSYGSGFDIKEQVRDATDIVELVGRYMELRRNGRVFVGHCPWHDDRRPSLQVNPERQSFKCWVCDIGGDIFSFIMQIEGVDFPEALSILADQAGISIERHPSGGSSGHGSHSHQHGPAGNSSSSSSTPSVDRNGPFIAPLPNSRPSSSDMKRMLHDAMAWAESQYHQCLLESPEAEPARKYLLDRNITWESIQKFRLGFSPNQSNWLSGRSGNHPGCMHLLETVGVLARSEMGGGMPYDRFRGRVLFPIHDVRERSVGIGGRVLPESGTTSKAKYINSPETPIFSKSRLLYALDLARQSIRQSGMALVMEGYTDVIVAHQYGFTEAVAVLGTALGEEHIKLLGRYAERIVLVLDGDQAGRKRADEVLPLFVENDVDLRILTLPAGADPCDYLNEHGAESFRSMIETNAVDALEHAFQSATSGIDLDNDIHNASRALQKLLEIFAKVPISNTSTGSENMVRYQKMLQRTSARFRIDEQDLRGRLNAIRDAVRRQRETREQFSRNQPGSDPNAMGGDHAPRSENVEGSHRGPVNRQTENGLSRAVTTASRFDPLDRELLEMLLRYPIAAPQLFEEIPVQGMVHPIAKQLYEIIIDLHFERR